MKKKPHYEKVDDWAYREAENLYSNDRVSAGFRTGRHRAVGWLAAVLGCAYMTGYRAAQRRVRRRGTK